MTVVIVVCGLLLTICGVCAVVRAERGPSMLDRTVALDIVVTTLTAAGALFAAVERRTDIVPILVVLSLVGFVGSVTIARAIPTRCCCPPDSCPGRWSIRFDRPTRSRAVSTCFRRCSLVSGNRSSGSSTFS